MSNIRIDTGTKLDELQTTENTRCEKADNDEPGSKRHRFRLSCTFRESEGEPPLGSVWINAIATCTYGYDSGHYVVDPSAGGIPIGGNFFDVQDVCQALSPTCLLQTDRTESTKCRSFQNVQHTVNGGFPKIWAIQLPIPLEVPAESEGDLCSDKAAIGAICKTGLMSYLYGKEVSREGICPDPPPEMSNAPNPRPVPGGGTPISCCCPKMK